MAVVGLLIAFYIVLQVFGFMFVGKQDVVGGLPRTQVNITTNQLTMVDRKMHVAGKKYAHAY